MTVRATHLLAKHDKALGIYDSIIWMTSGDVRGHNEKRVRHLFCLALISFCVLKTRR